MYTKGWPGDWAVHAVELGGKLLGAALWGLVLSPVCYSILLQCSLLSQAVGTMTAGAVQTQSLRCKARLETSLLVQAFDKAKISWANHALQGRGSQGNSLLVKRTEGAAATCKLQCSSCPDLRLGAVPQAVSPAWKKAACDAEAVPAGR